MTKLFTSVIFKTIFSLPKDNKVTLFNRNYYERVFDKVTKIQIMLRDYKSVKSLYKCSEEESVIFNRSRHIYKYKIVLLTGTSTEQSIRFLPKVYNI